jgi:hypothetical protein
MRVTRGASHNRMVPGGMSCRAKTPRPLDSEVRISMAMLRVSGDRSVVGGGGIAEKEWEVMVLGGISRKGLFRALRSN